MFTNFFQCSVNSDPSTLNYTENLEALSTMAGQLSVALLIIEGQLAAKAKSRAAACFCCFARLNNRRSLHYQSLYYGY
jgi:hypothetical protein